MTRTDWLRWRQGGLGGSDLGQIPSIVAAVGGDPSTDCSPWGGEWHVWALKQGEPEEGRDREDLETGRLLERAILDWAADQIVPPGHSRSVAEWPSARLQTGRLLGTPDGLVQYWSHHDYFDAVRTQSAGVECKVSDAWKPWDAPPLYYQLQCRAYMALTNRPVWYLAAFFRHAPAWRLYTIERDLDIEARMLAAVEDWWEQHIVQGHPPEVDDSGDCARELARLHPRTAGASVADFRVATDEEQTLCQQIAQADLVAADLAAAIATDKNRLRASIGDAAGIRWTGGKARWSRNNLKITVE